MKYLTLPTIFILCSLALSPSHAEEQIKREKKQPHYSANTTNQQTTNRANDITNGEPEVQKFSGGAWGRCVLNAGLGSWIGGAFCATGGLLHDVID